MRPRLGYLPALDGLRAISIALVVGYHAFGFPFGGTIGVDVFFVLSGFLITSLLLEEQHQTGRIALRGFYGRRVRRLLPALLFMLAVYLIVTAAVGKDELLAAIVGGSYVANFFDAAGNPLLTSAHLNQLWSLAQEEQFYLLWPVALILLSRSRQLLKIVVAVAVVVMLLRAGLSVAGASPNRLYYEPYLRADGLLVGASIAVVHARRPIAVSEWAGKIGVAGLVLGAVFGWGFESWAVWGEPLFLLSVGLLLLAALSKTDLARGLEARPLVWLGRRSYSLYLWHVPVIAAVVYVAGSNLAADAAGVLAATATAALSYRFVEQPFRRRRIPDAPAVDPVAASVAA